MTALKFSLNIFVILLLFCCCFQDSVQENNCENSNATVTLYANYLQCLSTSQNIKAVEMDQELLDEAKRTVKTCFADTILDARKTKKCFFDHDLLKTEGLAWSPRGPLKNCPLCLQFAKYAVDGIVGADQQTAQCVRKIVYPAIGREGGECLKKNVSDFSDNDIPAIPDFEIESMKSPKTALESISVEILRSFRLEKCRGRNPEWAENTEKCLQNPQLENYMQKHCQTTAECHQGLSSNCSETLEAIERPTCDCLRTLGDEIKKKLKNVGADLKQLYQARPLDQKLGAATRPEIEKCVETIRKEVKTPANDWYDLVNESLQKCGKSGMQFKSLLQVFCGAVIREIGVTGVQALDTSFQFLGSLIDAIVDRMARYCTEHCPFDSTNSTEAATALLN